MTKFYRGGRRPFCGARAKRRGYPYLESNILGMPRELIFKFFCGGRDLGEISWPGILFKVKFKCKMHGTTLIIMDIREINSGSIN